MNVIPLRPRTYTSRERFIAAVCDEIFRSHMTYAVIAHRAGVATGTIHNLATGKTRWPRDATLFGVINALNLAIRLERRR